MPRWSRWWQYRKIEDNNNEGVIHRYITDNKKETNWVIFIRVIEECPYKKTPAEMEECVNDEYYDDK